MIDNGGRRLVDLDAARALAPRLRIIDTVAGNADTGVRMIDEGERRLADLDPARITDTVSGYADGSIRMIDNGGRRVLDLDAARALAARLCIHHMSGHETLGPDVAAEGP